MTQNRGERLEKSPSSYYREGADSSKTFVAGCEKERKKRGGGRGKGGASVLKFIHIPLHNKKGGGQRRGKDGGFCGRVVKGREKVA